jgi:peptidoglycan L-alanyl-D-glutamate endopeptidase CwlK
MTRAVIDSHMTFSEALDGSVAPDEVVAMLVTLDIQYFGFDGNIHAGQIVVHKDLQGELANIFKQLLLEKFPIYKAAPVVAYEWDDHTSIRDNNTSGFNYRNVFDTHQLSYHAYGRAIDINPLVNPYVTKGGKTRPIGPAYNPDAQGAIRDGDKIVNLFLERGWEWGGHWKDKHGYVDYQHFQKPTLERM